MESKTERLNKLKLLIQEAEENIKLRASSLNKLDEDLSLKREEIKIAQESILKFKTPKLFTRREIENFKRKKLKEEKEKLEYEKLNIISKTKEAFEKAKIIKADAMNKSEKEKLMAEKIAGELELNALKREVYILNCVLKEKTNIFEDILAKEMCKKIDLKINYSFKEKTSQIKKEMKILKLNLEQLKNDVDDISLKLKKSLIKLNNYNCD